MPIKHNTDIFWENYEKLSGIRQISGSAPPVRCCEHQTCSYISSLQRKFYVECFSTVKIFLVYLRLLSSEWSKIDYQVALHHRGYLVSRTKYWELQVKLSQMLWRTHALIFVYELTCRKPPHLLLTFHSLNWSRVNQNFGELMLNSNWELASKWSKASSLILYVFNRDS